VLKYPDRARVLHELRRATAIAGNESDWAAMNAKAYEALGAWTKASVARGEMKDMPLSVWVALVIGPLLQLTPGWLQQDKPTVPPRLRTLLSDAAWAAVRT
jgi:hypothetical protein